MFVRKVLNHYIIHIINSKYETLLQLATGSRESAKVESKNIFKSSQPLIQIIIKIKKIKTKTTKTSLNSKRLYDMVRQPCGYAALSQLNKNQYLLLNYEMKINIFSQYLLVEFLFYFLY